VRRVRARHEQGELEKLSSVEGQFGNLPLVDDFAHDGIADVQQRHGRRHVDLLRHAASLEHDIQADPLIHF
jgi:hypothetical protein